MIYRFLLSLLFITTAAVVAQAQTYPYYGCVTDSAGEALIGANISVKNTRLGTVTDLEGCFTLQLPDSLATLVVSYTGFESSEAPAQSGKTFNLSLASATALLDVVVVGAAVEYRSDRSYSMSTAPAESPRRRDSERASRDKGSPMAMPPPPPPPAPMLASYTSDDRASGPEGRPAAPVSEGSTTTQAAGQLTAGEINDFNKWELWQDIRAEDLAMYRSSWLMNAQHRFVLQVTNELGSPAVNIPVLLYGPDQQVVWKARTDNTGKAECWAGFWGAQDTLAKASYRLVALYGGKEYPAASTKSFQEGINFVQLPAACTERPLVDIAFVVDATGSMSDEIQYLQSELLDVALRVKDSLPQAELRLGSVFYRDHGDEYLTRVQPITADLTEAMAFVRRQQADGGGDFPEALDDALSTALSSLQWRREATTRLLFLVLDAPPHTNPENIQKIQKATQEAAAQGIRIIPITCSGIDKSTEYLMRVMALGSNGSYTFLTDHSGIGNAHIEPTTDTYEVEKLNDMLVRIINGFSRLASCEQMVQPLASIDSVVIHNPAQPTDPQAGQGLSWTYFPNPTAGPVSVQTRQEMAQATLYLSDANGKLLERYALLKETLQLNLSAYPAGLYYLIVETGDTRSSGRLIRIDN